MVGQPPRLSGAGLELGGNLESLGTEGRKRYVRNKSGVSVGQRAPLTHTHASWQSCVAATSTCVDDGKRSCVLICSLEGEDAGSPMLSLVRLSK